MYMNVVRILVDRCRPNRIGQSLFFQHDAHTFSRIFTQLFLIDVSCLCIVKTVARQKIIIKGNDGLPHQAALLLGSLIDVFQILLCLRRKRLSFSSKQPICLFLIIHVAAHIILKKGEVFKFLISDRLIPVDVIYIR